MDFNNSTDAYFEQIVRIKKTPKTSLAIIGIWVLALILTFLMFTVVIPLVPALSSIVIFICFGIAYGAYWLCTKLNVEFEYIITNGTMDIDKIINRSSRKRIVTFELSGVTRLEKYNAAAIKNINQKDIITACNLDDENAYFMAVSKSNGDTVNLIFSPNDKLKSAISKFAPKFVTNSAFK